MSAKFLHGITDDPQLEKQIDKQIGCMTGFLQLFDRHQILTGKRLYGPKRLSAARSCSNSPGLDASVASAQNVTSEDGRRLSVVSSGYSNTAPRAAATDCNDNTRQPMVCKEQAPSENLETAQAPLQSKTMENSARLSVDSKNVRAAGVRESSKASVLSKEQPRSSLDLSRHSLDFRDVVRDSFHRDVPRLSTDTRIAERASSRFDATKYTTNKKSSTDGKDTTKIKEVNSLSPKSLLKSKEQAYASSDVVGNSTMDTKLKKASWKAVDNKESKKSSLELKADPRLSNDGREILRTSLFECKDAFRSSLKLREAPRLSLDSRARLDQRGGLCAMEIRNIVGDNMQSIHADGHSCEHPSDDLQEMGGEKKRSPSVVARLMGLEAMPDSSPTTHKKAELRRSASESRISRDIVQCRYTEANNSQFKSSMDMRKDSNCKAVEADPRQVLSSQKQQESSSFTLSKTHQSRQFQTQFDDNQSSGRREEILQQTLRYPAGSIQGLFPPRLKQSEAVPKYISMQRSMIETAPWKQQDRWHSFQQKPFEAENIVPENKRYSPQGTDVLYSEIERKLKQRGLEESGKDLETLKQILEAMQLKGLLYSQINKEMKQHQQSRFPQQNEPDHISRMSLFREAKAITRAQEMQGKLGRPFEAPIVVMKPTKLPSNLKPAKTPGILSNHAGKVAYGLPHIANKGNASSSKASGNCSHAKTREFTNHFGNEIALTVRPRRERIASEALQIEANSRRTRTSISSQPVAGASQSSSGLNSAKNPSSSSTSKQRITKAETEKKVEHSGNIMKGRDDHKGSLPMHSPNSARQITGRKMGPDTENKSPRSKMKVQQVYAMELHASEQNSIMDNPLTDEISLFSDSKGSTCMDLEKTPIAKSGDDKQCGPKIKYVEGNVLDCCNELLATAEIPEQPSPVSVLDTSFYKEDCSPSPVMKRSINFKEEEARQQDESDLGTWNHLGFISRQSELDELKLDDSLVTCKAVKFSNDVILKPEMDSIGSSPELKCSPSSNNKLNPEFCYITDIFLISGLLEDRRYTSTVFYSSDFPIDPKLFFVLEQRWTDLSSSKLHDGQDSCLKTNLDKMNRQLIFNTVNNILRRKLLPYFHPHPWTYPQYRIQRRQPTGKELLKQVWDEFRCLPSIPSEDICDTLCSILQKDLSETVDSWSDHTTEFEDVVLDVERMIFKDLIDETIRDMTVVSGKCRQSNFVATIRRQLLFN